MNKFADFESVFQKASDGFYDRAINDYNTGCKRKILMCRDRSDVINALDNYRYTNNCIDNLDDAIDGALSHDNDGWAVLAHYANPIDILSGYVDGIKVWGEFKNDIFDEAKHKIVNNLEDILSDL